MPLSSLPNHLLPDNMSNTRDTRSNNVVPVPETGQGMTRSFLLVEQELLLITLPQVDTLIQRLVTGWWRVAARGAVGVAALGGRIGGELLTRGDTIILRLVER